MVGKVFGWMKAHFVVVACVVIVVVSLPVAYVVSSGMGKKIDKQLQERVDSEFHKVDRQNVSYRLPGFSPEAEEVSLSKPPNAALTAWFSARAAELRDDAERVSAEGIAFNKRDHEVLVSGLFPEPTNADDRRLKPYEFLRALMGYRGRASVAEGLMEGVNGGSPPDPTRVAILVQEEQTRYIADLERQRGPGQNLSSDEEEAMTENLREARVDEYRRQAGRLGVYFDMEVLKGAIEIPDAEPEQPPSLSSLFEKQWNVWIVSDVLDAIALANTDARGRAQRIVPVSSGADGSIVKRINAIDVRLGGDNIFGYLVYEGAETVVDRGGQGQNDGLAGTAESWSLTGRLTHPDNQVYDVIDVGLDLIVDVERLPRLLRAFEETNFMSVLDVDLEEVDVWKDLQEGYIYGKGSIVEAKILLETVWLREWTAPLMPVAFREGLGVTGFDSAEDD